MNPVWRRRLKPPRRLKTTREGKWFIALTLGVGIAAVNTGNNLLYIVLSANLSIVVLSGILSELSLRGIRVSISQPSEAFTGCDALLAVTCFAPPERRFPALSLDVSFRIDGAPAPLTTRMADFGPGTAAVRVVTFRAGPRGVRGISGTALSTRFPFALFEKSLEPVAPEPVVVYPAPGRQSPGTGPIGRGSDADDRPGGRGTGAGIRGVRDYAPGDPAHDIQWKATARLGRRMVKEREGEREGLREIRLPEGSAGPAFEADVSRACGEVLRCERAGTPYRIHHGGRVAVDGSARGTRQAALRFLATVPPHPLPGPFAKAKKPAGRRGPSRTANVVTAAPTPDTVGILWLLPRIFWGSGLLMLGIAGVPWPVLAVAAAAFAGGIGIELGALPPFRDRRPETVLGGFVSLAAVADFVLGGRDPLRSGALLVLGIQSIRFLFPKRAADCWQLTAVTFLEFLAAAATESGPRFVLVASAFLLLCPGAMWSHQSLGRAEAGSPGTPVPPRFAAGLLLSVAGAGILLSALLFTVTPRLRVGHLSRKAPSSRTTIGFSDTLSPGDISGAASDRRVAARVDFRGRDGKPAAGDAYLKGASYSRFTGILWRKGAESPAPAPRVGSNYFLAQEPAESRPSEAEITLEPLDSAAFFTYGSPLTAEGPLGILRVDRAGNLSLPTSDRPAIRYRIRFLPGPLPPSGVFPPPQDADLRMPPGDWRELAALSAEIAPPGLPDAARARKLVAFLQSGYRYTLTGSARDIRDFLFVRKAGYCEHFATALCLLLRSSGIPARAAAGYLGGEWNEVGNYRIVRQSNAHAWTEGWVDGRWVTLDATPAVLSEGPTAMLPTGKGEKYLDWLRHQWDRYVVDYDLAAQAKGIEAIGEAIRKIPSSGPAAAGNALRGPAAGGVIAAAGLALFLWNRRRIRRNTRRGSSGTTPLPTAYARLFATLERNGWRESPGTPPAEMLAKATAARPGLESGSARFTALYHRDRFGAVPLSADLRTEAFLLADRLRAGLSRETAR